MVGSTGVAHRERRDAQILQRFDPLRENRGDGRVALQIDAANFSTAVVDVEIRRELLMIRLELNGAGRIAIELRNIDLVGRVRTRHKTEVLLHVAI